jgi:hypothetical protein
MVVETECVLSRAPTTSGQLLDIGYSRQFWLSDVSAGPVAEARSRSFQFQPRFILHHFKRLVSSPDTCVYLHLRSPGLYREHGYVTGQDAPSLRLLRALSHVVSCPPTPQNPASDRQLTARAQRQQTAQTRCSLRRAPRSLQRSPDLATALDHQCAYRLPRCRRPEWQAIGRRNRANIRQDCGDRAQAYELRD